MISLHKVIHSHQHWQDQSYWKSPYFTLKFWKIVFLKVIIWNHNLYHTYQKHFFTLSLLYLWYLYKKLFIIINIDKSKAIESLYILYTTSDKSNFKGHCLKPRYFSYLSETILYLIFIISMIHIHLVVHYHQHWKD